MKFWREKILFLAGALVVLWPLALYAQVQTGLNAGFVSGIWYSKSPFFAGDEIRIYSAIQNNSPYDLVGKMGFFDGEHLIGETDFTVIKGQVIQRWVDWTVTAGSHAVYATITESKKSEIGKLPQPIELFATSSGRDERLVADHPIAPVSEASSSASAMTGSLSEVTARLTIAAKEKIMSLFDANKQAPAPTEGVNTSSLVTEPSEQPTATDWAKNIAGRVWENIKMAFNERVVQKVAEHLHEKDTALKERIETGNNTTPLLADEISKIEEKTSLKIPTEKKPTVEQLYRWLIVAAIYVLNSQWLLVIVGLIMLRLVWKLFRLLHGRDDDDKRW